MTLTGRKGTAVVAVAIVSLCLNLLLAGFMIGGRWHGGPDRRGPWMANMPEEAKPVIKEVFDAHKSDFDVRRKAVADARMKVAELLKADTIDQAQLNQALSELLQRTQEMQQFGHQVLIDVAQKLPPKLRQEMADRWNKDRFRMKPGP